jgi:hypothetical protein
VVVQLATRERVEYRESVHHRGGDRHRRRFICIAPSDGVPAQIPRFAPQPAIRFGRRSGTLDRICYQE